MSSSALIARTKGENIVQLARCAHDRGQQLKVGKSRTCSGSAAVMFGKGGFDVSPQNGRIQQFWRTKASLLQQGPPPFMTKLLRCLPGHW